MTQQSNRKLAIRCIKKYIAKQVDTNFNEICLKLKWTGDTCRSEHVTKAVLSFPKNPILQGCYDVNPLRSRQQACLHPYQVNIQYYPLLERRRQQKALRNSRGKYAAKPIQPRTLITQAGIHISALCTSTPGEHRIVQAKAAQSGARGPKLARRKV